MVDKVLFAPEVFNDLDEGYGWYEEKRPGLGNEWILSIDACIQSVRRSPLAYPIVFKKYRRALTHRFPYAVFFEVRDKQLFVYAVMHTSKHPRRWKKRLGR